MTHDEIFKLPPGSEIDALVATKVMGFVDLGSLRLADLRYQMPTQDGVVVLGKLPHYSTDIAAAWQISEKCMYFMVEGRDKYGWNCELRFSSEGNIYESWSESCPLAICRAALYAVIDRQNEGRE